MRLGQAAVPPALPVAADPSGGWVDCTVYPAEPAPLAAGTFSAVRVEEQPGRIRLGNDFLSADVSTGSGLIVGVLNRLTDRYFEVDGDRTGLTVFLRGQEESWPPQGLDDLAFQVHTREEKGASQVVFEAPWSGGTIRLAYRLEPDHFWVERRLSLEVPGEMRVERLEYGRNRVDGASTRVLELGKFDRPQLHESDGGGLFNGVGWWFYEFSPDQVYQNSEMNYRCRDRFDAEPFYLGVFESEPGEPYPGWLWYKAFLQIRKLAHDKRTTSVCWNAGYGQWGIDIDNPSAPEYIRFVHELGVREIGFGGGPTHPPIPSYIEKVKQPGVARDNLQLCRSLGLSVGFLEAGWLKEKWADGELLEKMHAYLEEFAELGFGSYFFDYFSTIDTFTAHRHVTDYFRDAHEKLHYVECHLGMAAYGPQFQREALVNHPTDLEGFDIRHFSSDWTTFLGFRLSRRQWQQRYQYLMPEYGLYYFASHYANREHPRLYSDPEPQQLLFKYESYNGISWNFHDLFGFRDAIAGLTAFTPFFVFGHLDLRMPESEKAFARAFLGWTRSNVEVIRLGRVCHEDDKSCVVSKLAAGKGAVYVLNYGPGDRSFRLDLQPGSARRFSLRQVYPVAAAAVTVRPGEPFELTVRGESVAILEVNGAFSRLPPENRVRRLDLADWHRTPEGWRLETPVPAIPDPPPGVDQGLPRHILAVDQLENPPDPVVGRIGKGKLGERFLEALGFDESHQVETWKLAPWAYRGRVWFVYAPRMARRLQDPLPEVVCNGTVQGLVPRIDDRFEEQKDYQCPILFADVTEAIRRGSPTNRFHLSGVGSDQPEQCYLVWNENPI